MPVENSTGGLVSHTLDLLADMPLPICGEVWLPVHHLLLARGLALDAISVVYAHPQTFAQCRKWLDSNLPGARREPVASNGQAARMVSENGQGAAIAGNLAAERWNLDILASCIEDDPDNTTRFLVIGRHRPERTGRDKTSVVLSAHRGEAGALFKLMEPFAKAGINLTRIESRPSRRAAWDYNFFLDLDGHQDDPEVGPVLEQVQMRAAMFKVLGSYPRAIV